MLDFSNFAKDFEAIADRWAFERLLRTNRTFRQRRVARMIAGRSTETENMFCNTERELCTALDDEFENLFA